MFQSTFLRTVSKIAEESRNSCQSAVGVCVHGTFNSKCILNFVLKLNKNAQRLNFCHNQLKLSNLLLKPAFANRESQFTRTGSRAQVTRTFSFFGFNRRHSTQFTQRVTPPDPRPEGRDPRPEGLGPRLFFDFLGRELTFFRNSLQGEAREWEKETPCGKGLGSWDT